MHQSPLHDFHNANGAKFAPFAGWNMPIQYQGIVTEHEAVRENCGIFDISHMGQIHVTGEDAQSYLDTLLTNDVSSLAVGEAHYTFLLNEDGGVIDDLLLYRLDRDAFFLVVNAARTEEDWAWMNARTGGLKALTLTNQSAHWAGVAVQGPRTEEVWNSLQKGIALPARNGIHATEDLIICRTGYTGEDGFELFTPSAQITSWAEQLTEAGAIPCGLGARDTLRLEKCYPLNGSDLSLERTPLEAGLGFFVKLDKAVASTGAAALLKQKKAGLAERLHAIQMDGKAPPMRAGYTVLSETGEALGTTTSGGLSPSLKLGIGLAYLPTDRIKVGSQVLVEIRGKTYGASVVKKPFV